MILERAEHPEWTSNAYLVADGDGGHGVLVDSNGVEEPLLALVDERGITITHVLVTHQHGDHVVDVDRARAALRRQVVGSELTKQAGVPIDETFSDGDIVRSGALEIQAIATPGHCRRPPGAARERHRLPHRATASSRARSAARWAAARPATPTSTTRS